MKTAHSHPDDPEILLRMALNSLDNGAFQSARKSLALFLESRPDHTQAIAKLGVALASLGHKGEAVQHFCRALEIDPAYGPAAALLSVALYEDSQFEDAEEVCRAALEKGADFPALYSAHAQALRANNKLEEAETTLRTALEKDPHLPEIQANLASILLELGRKDEAIACYEEAIDIDPANAWTRLSLAQIKTFSGGFDPHIADMQALLEDKKTDNENRAWLHFALGKAYETLDDYALSFTHYERGNALINRALDYMPEQTQQEFAALKNRNLTQQIAANEQNANDPVPVFIVGMPRSGTSLAEQILASHPSVAGAGELNNLELIALQDTIDPGAAQDYLARLKALGGDAPYITDKMPSNFRYIGLIQALFPRALIIHCTRDLRDTCLSIFKHFFVGALDFAYSQENIAQYYTAYLDLMAHWENLFPGRIFTLNYETLLEDQEATTRTLLEYCGLEWNDACLRFYETARPVKTASATQVRRPLYKDSIGYWKNYKDYLDPEIINLGG